ncbi:MAG: hypothetical protein ACJAS1_006670, partial [Oleiphilaceae bacterium]
MKKTSDLSEISPPRLKSSETVASEQALRIKRLGMSCGSYVFTFFLVCF